MQIPARVTATEAARSFSNLLNQVSYQGKTFEIKRGREIIARITPVLSPAKGFPISSLNEFFSNLPALDNEDIKDFEKTITQIRSKTKKEKNPWD